MTDKTGAPPCGIYIRIKAVADKNAMGDILRKMRQMNLAINQSSGYARNNQMIEITVEEGARDAAALAVQIIKVEGAIAILKDEIGLAGEFEADGVIISKGFAQARDALGEDAIIGLESETEEGDFVMISADPAKIAKLRAKNDDVVIAVRGSDITNENCGALAQAGADYIDVTDYIYAHEEGAIKATVNIMYALEMAKSAVN